MISENLHRIKNALPAGVKLIAVSKKKSKKDILAAYQEGQVDFGENYVQELVEKQEALPKDIHWHFIGHLQSNKVKYLAPFVHMIHGVDSFKLLKEINKQAKKVDRKISVLLQVHIAKEDSKFGFSDEELEEMITKKNLDELKHISIRGLMGMATNSSNEDLVRSEFKSLSELYYKYRSHEALQHHSFTELSMGMTQDYPLAIDNGSTMVRIGSAIFGSRK